MPRERLKRCPRCRAEDTTDFSTCRHCGAKYSDAPPIPGGAKAQPQGFNINLALLGLIVVVILGAVGQHMWMADSASKKEINNYKVFQKSNKPRVLEFYSDSEDSKKYHNVITEASQRFAGRVDFAQINFDNPGAKSIKELYGATSAPFTIFLDAFGRPAGTAKGALTSETLESYLQPLSEGAELPISN